MVSIIVIQIIDTRTIINHLIVMFNSLGLSAIFLIGGRSLDDKPTALLLRSGDTVVMSRESRLCYHGVPKVLSKTDEHLKYDNEWEEPFKNYMKSTRINLNVRQVNKVV